MRWKGDLSGSVARRPLAVAALALLVSLAPATAWALGELTQDPGAAGCVSQSGVDGVGGLCQLGKALAAPADVAVSADGKNVYVASSESGAVATFDRDPETGELTQKLGTEGCISTSTSGGACRKGKVLNKLQSISVSPDGRNLYAVSTEPDAVAILNRDPATGALAQVLGGTAGCFVPIGSMAPCQPAKAIETPLDVAVSPGGENVYVASFGSDAVAVFDRDLSTGALSQQDVQPGAGIDGCIAQLGGTVACQPAKVLDKVLGVAVSPDGLNVYTANSDSNSVAVLKRDPATGALAQELGGSTGCLAPAGGMLACLPGKALDPSRVAVSPDGQQVYVSSHDPDAVAILDRDSATGELSQQDVQPGEGIEGCIAQLGGPVACQPAKALETPGAIVVSPDGEQVYVAGSDAIAILDRDSATGALSQQDVQPGEGIEGCIAQLGGPVACQPAKALDAPVGVVISPDGRHLYAASRDSHAVAVLRRTVPTPPDPPPDPPIASAADTEPPGISRFRLSPGRLRLPKIRAAFTFVLSEPAGVRIAIERSRPGRKLGDLCRKPSAALARRPRCRRFVKVMTIGVQRSQEGSGEIALRGVLAEPALQAGSHRATIVAVDAAGNASSPQGLSFSVRRRRG